MYQGCTSEFTSGHETHLLYTQKSLKFGFKNKLTGPEFRLLPENWHLWRIKNSTVKSQSHLTLGPMRRVKISRFAQVRTNCSVRTSTTRLFYTRRTGPRSDMWQGLKSVTSINGKMWNSMHLNYIFTSTKTCAALWKSCLDKGLQNNGEEKSNEWTLSECLVKHKWYVFKSKRINKLIFST